MGYDRLLFRKHAIQRMFKHRINDADVRHALKTGEIIEEYPDDKPFPSRLVLGWHGDRPIHVVAADDSEGQETIVITAYEPDPGRRDSDFKRRKRS